MKVYSPSDIAELLNVKESTLRKYSALLEDAGYEIKRNNHNQRWYSDNDVIAFRKFVSLKNSGDMTLKEAAEAISQWSKGGSVSEYKTDTQSGISNHESDMSELKELIHKQTETIKALADKMDEQQDQLNQQQKYIDESIKERDKILMETLEAQKQIASSEENKQGFFKRLFSK